MKTVEEILAMTGEQLAKEKAPTICTFCTFCSDCSGCSGCSGCSNCSNCSDCLYCSDCSNCYKSSNLNEKHFTVLNVQLTEEQYQEVMDKLKAT